MNLVTFDFNDSPVRSVTIGGEPWFVGKDVCRCLDIQNNRDAIARLADDERRDVNLNSVGSTDGIRPGNLNTVCSSDGIRPGNPNVVAVNEPGVYRLVFESRKPEAEAFRRWIFHEVLPSLRRTGEYALADIDWDDMREKIAMVKQARLTFGKAAARGLWERLGLPDIGEEASAQPGENETLLTYLNDFIEECTEQDAAAQVTGRELYTVYRAWAAATRLPVMTETMFGRLMRQTGIRKHTSRHVIYSGIRIRADVRRRMEAKS